MASVTPVTSNVDDQNIINDDHDGGDHLGTDVDVAIVVVVLAQGCSER
jgi:hypothetical protein